MGIKILLLWHTGYKVETMLMHFEVGLSRFAAIKILGFLCFNRHS